MSPRKVPALKALWAISLMAFLGGTAYGVLSGADEASAAAEAQAAAPTAAGEAKEEAKAGEGEKVAEGEKSASAEKPAEATHAAPARKPSGGCIADSAAVEDVRRLREELAAKSQELAAKEAELKAREKAIEEEMKKLSLSRDELNKLSAVKNKQQEENVNKLIETLETMSPKAASQLVASIDEQLAVTAMSKMSTVKLAKIMNVMDAQRSTRLSELLSGVSRRQAPAPMAQQPRSAAPAPAAAPVAAAPQASAPASGVQVAKAPENLTKGGDSRDQSNDQAARNAGREPAAAAAGSQAQSGRN